MTVNRTSGRPAASWQLLWRKETRKPPWRKVVLGLGDSFFGDEGLGIRALPYLQAGLGPRSRVEWIDGGVLGMNLMLLVEQCSHLLVVDAVDAGRPPGDVIELSLLRLLKPHGYRLSEPQVAFQDMLKLAQVLDQGPVNFRLVGLQPGCLETGTHLSQPVAAALPALRRRVQDVLETWGLMGGR